MFFILSILILFFTTILILMFSKINISIKNLIMSSDKTNGKYIEKNYEIKLQLTLFKFIKIINIKITNNKLKKLKRKGTLKKIEKSIKNSNTKIDITTLKELKRIKYKISNLDLDLSFCLEEAAYTAVTLGILSTLIGIILKNNIGDDKDNHFRITPLYINRILINLHLDCIITVKLIHIIYILYILSKKRRDDKNVRTSNRRPYAYSNG